MDVLLTAEGFDVTTADSAGAAELALATLTPDGIGHNVKTEELASLAGGL